MKYLLIIATTLLPICTILYGHETSENLIDNTAIAPPRMNHLAEGKAGPTVSRDDETLDNRDDKQRRRHFLGFGGGNSDIWTRLKLWVMRKAVGYMINQMQP